MPDDSVSRRGSRPKSGKEVAYEGKRKEFFDDRIMPGKAINLFRKTLTFSIAYSRKESKENLN